MHLGSGTSTNIRPNLAAHAPAPHLITFVLSSLFMVRSVYMHSYVCRKVYIFKDLGSDTNAEVGSWPPSLPSSPAYMSYTKHHTLIKTYHTAQHSHSCVALSAESGISSQTWAQASIIALAATWPPACPALQHNF